MSVEQGEALPAGAIGAGERRSYYLLGQSALLLAFLGLWQLASNRLIDSFFISSPLAVAGKLFGWALDGTLWDAFSYTFQATAGGFLSVVDLPPVPGVLQPWVGTDPPV